MKEFVIKLAVALAIAVVFAILMLIEITIYQQNHPTATWWSALLAD